MRTCIGCRVLKPKHELLRIVRKKNCTIELDLTGKAPGRGAYICMNIDCAKLALKRRGVDRTFKLDVPDNFYDTLLEYFNLNYS